MKKILVFFSAATFIVSCGNNSSDATNNTGTTTDSVGTTATEAPTTATTTPADADVEKGLTLIAQSDCLTCHKVEEKLVGPAYREVAKKYPNDQTTIDSLASKIIHGGKENWGDIMMTPHAALAKEDAQAMVKYIMSLK